MEWTQPQRPVGWTVGRTLVQNHTSTPSHTGAPPTRKRKSRFSDAPPSTDDSISQVISSFSGPPVPTQQELTETQRQQILEQIEVRGNQMQHHMEGDFECSIPTRAQDVLVSSTNTKSYKNQLKFHVASLTPDTRTRL